MRNVSRDPRVAGGPDIKRGAGEKREAGELVVREGKLLRFPTFNVTINWLLLPELVNDYGWMHVRWEFLSHTRMAGEEGCPTVVMACKLLKKITK
jgi:hypothetical protein